MVLHYTGMGSARAALTRLCDPAFEVSAHYLIDEGGEVAALVPEERRAWHAGAGRWGEVTDVNSRSVGIEVQNRGDHPFGHGQMASLERLLGGIMARWAIPPERVIAHSDLAPARKVDPGPRFDWRRLARAGLSVWPDEEDEGDLWADLAAAGYDPEAPPEALLRAFRLRFRPWAVGTPGGPADATDAGIARGLAHHFPVDRDGRAASRGGARGAGRPRRGTVEESPGSTRHGAG